MLGEPTNDLDTDMLAAIEDLLDSWPGTLIVVSHDRYFLERVTDQQYAILDHRLRHLPGGVDEYLTLREMEQRRAKVNVEEGAAGANQRAVHSADEATGTAHGVSAPTLSGAELRAAEKERAAVERKMEKMQAEITQSREGLAELDQADYQLLAVEMAKITALEDEVTSLEERWLELSELLEG